MLKKEKDIKGVISREKRYSTLAKNEGKYAQKKLKEEKRKGLKEMAKDSAHEAKVAFSFAKKRKAIVKKEERKLRKS
jgi:hypothetical protein